MYFWEVGKGEALEVMPFPAAERGRALLQQLLGAAGLLVVARVCRRGDALVVQGLLLTFEGLPDSAIADPKDCERHDQECCRKARHGSEALVPPDELAHAVPRRRSEERRGGKGW